MSSNLRSVSFTKTNADIFPANEIVNIVDAISLNISVIGANSVQYQFLNSGDSGIIKPNDNYIPNTTNSDSITDQITFIFNGAAKVFIEWVEGTSGSSSAGNIEDLLKKKISKGYIVYLPNPNAGTWFNFPFNLADIFIEPQGYVGTTYQFVGTTITDTAILCKKINEMQKYFVFEPINATQILCMDGILSYTQLNELEIVKSGGLSVQYTSFSTQIGEVLTSWGDYMQKDLEQLFAVIRNVTSQRFYEHYVIDVETTYNNVKSLSFVVLNGTAKVELSSINQPGTTLQYPIIDAISIYGSTYNFTSPAQDIRFFDLTGEVLIQVSYY